MSTPILTSRNNSLVQTFRLVAGEARRAPADLVLAEGLRVLEEATNAGYSFDALLIHEKFGEVPREQALLARWSAANFVVRRAAGSLLKELSGLTSPQGALGLVRMPRFGLPDITLGANPLLLCLCGIQDPGNLGTLLRTALATGASLVCTTPGTVSARNPKAIRASAGAFFHVPLVEGLRPPELLAYCRVRRVTALRADSRSGPSCWAVDMRKGIAIILGNEARGLRGQEWPEATAVHVPMHTGVESLNVAVAGAALLFEAYRQRASGGPAAARGG